MTPKEQKCKIKDAAKDLNLTANDIIEIVKAHTGAEKKPAASLTESEMNIVLEHISQKNQVKSFDAYFAAGEKKKEEKPVKQEEKPAEVKAEKPEKPAEVKAEKPAKQEEKPAEVKAEKPVKQEEKPVRQDKKPAAQDRPADRPKSLSLIHI